MNEKHPNYEHVSVKLRWSIHSYEPAMHVDRYTAQNRNERVNDIRRREAVGRGALA